MMARGWDQEQRRRCPGDDADQECLTYLALLDIVSITNPEPLNSDTTKGYI
jgi:hypothetical protein